MNDDRRKHECPICKGNLFFQEGNMVYCAKVGGCPGIWENRREEDKKLPFFIELKRDWGV